MIWIVLLINLVASAFAVRAYLDLEDENLRLQGEAIVCDQKRRDLMVELGAEKARNVLLARENNRLRRQIRTGIKEGTSNE